MSEGLALRWRDVDLGRRRVLVRRSVNGGVSSPPKTAQSRRDVPVSHGVAQALWCHRQMSSPASDDVLVFSTRAGGAARQPPPVRARVQTGGEESGRPVGGGHALRHTCATSLFRSGMKTKQVQAWLGHHSAAFTLSVYVHLLPDELPDAPESAFLGSLGGEQEREHDASKPAETADVPALAKTVV